MDKNKEVEVLENATVAYIDTDVVEINIEHEAKNIYIEQSEIDIEIVDENVIEIDIEEAFPFTARGILDTTFKDKDVLIDGGIVNSVNNEVISMQEVLETCAALGGAENVSHGTLYGTEQPNCHPISAIEGLENELIEIKALKTVYSNGKGLAQYYKWYEIPTNSIGYFVTKLSDNTIKIIDNKNEDIFGVVAETAGFIGGQDNASRGADYGLVICAGEALVRCESDVEIGDYVTTNDGGEAKKSKCNYGYKVSAIENVHDIKYATISLNISANQMDILGTDIEDLGFRMGSAEKNITSAINVANKAYNLASGLGDIGSLNASTVEKAEQALDKAETALDTANGLNSQIQGAITTATQAKTLANKAVASAESIKTEAIGAANQALSEVETLKEEMTPLSEWDDGKGNSSFAGFVARANEDSAVLTDMVMWQGSTNESVALLEKKADENGAYIQGFVANIDKYSYGKYSQANRFTYEEALNILELGVVYVPSVTHPETYEKSEKYDAITYDFKKGYYYTWSTSTDAQGATIITWVESATPSVAFSGEYTIGNHHMPYWVAEADVTDDGIAYEKDCLYKLVDNTWVKVATLKGNLGSVTTSLLKQTSSSIETAITDVNNNYAGTKTWVENNQAAIQDVVSWHGDNGDSLVTFMQEAGDKFASATQIAQVKDKNGNVTSASIVTAVNNDKSGITLNADHINFEGFVSFANKSDVKEVQNASVYDVKVEYALSDSETVAPTDGWAITAPEWQENMYMWQKTTITKGDATTAETITCIQGAKGAQGGKGDKGDAGATVKSTSTQFYLSTSAESPIGGSWKSSPSAWKKDSYMWTREVYTLTNGAVAYSNPVIDNAFTTISGWCSSNDMTLIDGANIATGTMTANKITTGQLTSHGYTDTNTTVYSTTGTCFNLDDGSIAAPNFAVTSDGHLYAQQADISGHILATSGSLKNCTIDNSCRVAGWKLDEYGIRKDGIAGMLSIDANEELYSNYMMQSLVTPTIMDEDSGTEIPFFRPVRFYAGAASEYDVYDSKFAVLDDGSLYATAAHIEGEITATKGYIGGFTLGDHYMYISRSGSTTGIYMGDLDGTKGWIYVKQSLVTPTDSNGNPYYSTVRYYAGAPNSNDLYDSKFAVLNDGSLYTSAAQITGGMLLVDVGDDNHVKISENVGAMEIYNTFNHKDIWQKSYNCYPSLRLMGNQIMFKYYQSQDDAINGVDGSMTAMLIHRMDSIGMIGSFGVPSGSSITFEKGSSLILADGANVVSPTSLATSSDASLKHDIELLDSRYDVLFDNLISRRFKYNKGTSDRYHIGYVTQETKTALHKSGVSEQEFAALCTLNKDTDKEYDALRYDEFVSLNTWQIQKLKARVAALEERIAQLEK